MAVSLDDRLFEILACPAQDHGPLARGTGTDPDAAVLTCTACGRQYPIRDGIPVLLLDEATEPEAAAQGTDAEAPAAAEDPPAGV